MSWFSMKVTAREGHMPSRPGGRPWLSMSRQYSPLPMASCSMPANPRAYLELMPTGFCQCCAIQHEGLNHRHMFSFLTGKGMSYQQQALSALNLDHIWAASWLSCSLVAVLVCASEPEDGNGGSRCARPFVVKSKAAEVPPVLSHQLTVRCRCASWL